MAEQECGSVGIRGWYAHRPLRASSAPPCGPAPLPAIEIAASIEKYPILDLTPVRFCVLADTDNSPARVTLPRDWYTRTGYNWGGLLKYLLISSTDQVSLTGTDGSSLSHYYAEMTMRRLRKVDTRSRPWSTKGDTEPRALDIKLLRIL